MASDFRYGIRNLFRSGRFALVAIITLGVGMGAATAIFSVSDWVLFRSKRLPDDIYLIGGRSAQGSPVVARFDFQTRVYMQQKAAFSEYARASHFADNISLDGQPIGTTWMGIDANFLPMFGLKLYRGRNFLPDENKEGFNNVAIIRYDFWQKNFNGDPNALGRQIRVGSSVCTIVGILRDNPTFPAYCYAAVYRPLAYHSDAARPWSPQLFFFGRLRPEVSVTQAEEITRALKIEPPANFKHFLEGDVATVTSVRAAQAYEHREIYLIMMAAVGFLYAIACLNAANLALIRMLGQRREHSIHIALGSSRAGIVRLLLIDSILISICAALLGVLVANFLSPFLYAVTSGSFTAETWSAWHVSWRALAVLGGITALTSVLVAIFPAVRVLRSDPQTGLKEGGQVMGESPALARLRAGFVILQAALAIVLLAGAGLMIQTFNRLQKVDPGFDPRNKAKIFINFPANYPTESHARLDALRKLQSELAHLPDVKAVGFGYDVLMPGYYYPYTNLQGPHGTTLRAAMVSINVGFEDVAGMHLRAGDWLRKSEGTDVIINESLARACWPGQNPIGQYLRRADKSEDADKKESKGWQVIGVMADVRGSIREAPGYYIYVPESWSPENMNTFVLRLTQPFDPTFPGKIQKLLYAYDPNVIVSYSESMDEALTNQLWHERLANVVLKVLAVIALLLTTVGMYSVLAFTVSQRINEFGVRMALGATRRDLIGLVLRRGLTLAAIGLVCGVFGALLLGGTLQSLLYETSAQDPLVLCIVGAVLFTSSALACIVPALRAARADVAHLLRAQ